MYNASNALTKTTDYDGELIYQGTALGDTLKFINHEEGRVVMTGTSPEYQYHLKDHLGNVRTTFTTQRAVDNSIGTFEAANYNTEQSLFLRYDDARVINSTLFDHTYYHQTPPTAGAFSERLSGSANEKTGIARSISVMPGDTVNLTVYAKYVDPANSNNTAALTQFLAQIIAGTASAVTVIDGPNYSVNGITPFPYTGLAGEGNSTGTGPKAYLNYLVFDRNFVFVNGGYVQVSTAAKEDGTNVPHQQLTAQVVITQPGYVYTYLSNESTTPIEVYFDDFTVQQIKSPVVQQEDFYPFGLSFNSYQREKSLINNYLYNGKEQINDLGLDWADYGARMYMPEIGRWGVVDNMAEAMRRWSPYSYAFNNPIIFEDKDGNIPWPKIFGKNITAKVGNRGFSSTPVPHPIDKDGNGNPVMKSHEAVDLAAPEGTTIHALAEGTALTGKNAIDGNWVQIHHENGYMTMYDHIQENGTLVKDGQKVKDGQPIAEVGSTGKSDGGHLHLMMFKGIKKIDPTSIYNLQNTLHPDAASETDDSDKADLITNTSPAWAKKSKLGAYIYFTFTGNDPGLSDYQNDQRNGRKKDDSPTWSQIGSTIQTWLSSNPNIQVTGN